MRSRPPQSDRLSSRKQMLAWRLGKGDTYSLLMTAYTGAVTMESLRSTLRRARHTAHTQRTQHTRDSCNPCWLLHCFQQPGNKISLNVPQEKNRFYVCVWYKYTTQLDENKENGCMLSFICRLLSFSFSICAFM